MVVSSAPTGDPSKIQMKQGLLEGWWIDPWQENFTHLINSMYYDFSKPNMEFGKSHPSINSWVSKLQIQISVLQMSVVPGPDSQDTVIKRVIASLGLPCSVDARSIPNCT